MTAWSPYAGSRPRPTWAAPGAGLGGKIAGPADVQVADLRQPEPAVAVSTVLGTEVVVQDLRSPGDETLAVGDGVGAVQGDPIAPELTAAELATWLAAERSLQRA